MKAGIEFFAVVGFMGTLMGSIGLSLWGWQGTDAHHGLAVIGGCLMAGKIFAWVWSL
jgi:hypothetical protein